VRAQELLVRRVSDGCAQRLPFDRLCVAAGARPRQLPRVADGAAGSVVTLRDTDSVASLAQRLRGAGRIMVVGNGGIALELMCGARWRTARRRG